MKIKNIFVLKEAKKYLEKGLVRGRYDYSALKCKIVLTKLHLDAFWSYNATR